MLDLLVRSYPYTGRHTTTMQMTLYPSSRSDPHDSALISACVTDISSWMAAPQMKLNPSKSELLVIPGDSSPRQDLVTSLDDSLISPVVIALVHGVTMDEHLSFSSRIANLTRPCRILCHNIGKIRPFLSTKSARSGPCQCTTGVRNPTEPLVFDLSKFSNMTSTSLHWIPLAAWIRFQTPVLAYKAKNRPAPTYFEALITPPLHRTPSSPQAQLDSSHHVSRFTKGMHHVSSPSWFLGGGRTFP